MNITPKLRYKLLTESRYLYKKPVSYTARLV